MSLHVRPGIRETVLSITCLVAVLSTLLAVDVRVRERLSMVSTEVTTEGVGTWGERVKSLGAAIVQAACDQAVDQAPLLVFAGVGLVLLLFMLRT